MKKGKPKLKTKNFLIFPYRFSFFNFKFRAGFTLLEMVISIGIFSVIVMTAISIMIQVSRVQIKASNLQTILDNVRFGFELLTKELRTGTGYGSNSICGPGIGFKNSFGEDRVYYLDLGTKTIMRSLANVGPADCGGNNPVIQPLTSEDIEVNRLDFQIHGQNSGPGDGQPWLTINLEAKSKSPRYQLDSSINLQTTIVQRLRDLQ